MKRRKWIRRLSYGSIAVAVLAVVIGAAVPWIARWQLVTILERQTNGPVEVDQFSFTKASRASRSRLGSAHALLTALVTRFSTAW